MASKITGFLNDSLQSAYKWCYDIRVGQIGSIFVSSSEKGSTHLIKHKAANKIAVTALGRLDVENDTYIFAEMQVSIYPRRINAVR